MTACDFLVVGGGVAGLSVAWQMARYGRVIVLEREAGTGYHSSGRSATYYHFGIGNRPVRLLTQASGAFFTDPPSRASRRGAPSASATIMAARGVISGTSEKPSGGRSRKARLARVSARTV